MKNLGQALIILGVLNTGIASAQTEEVRPVIIDRGAGAWVWSWTEDNSYTGVSITPVERGFDNILWQIKCPIDLMNDQRACSFTFTNRLDDGRLPGGLYVDFAGSTEPQFICASAHDFPGKVAQIRVDKNAPVSMGENGCVTADEILPELLTGAEVTVRHYSLPYPAARDSVHSLRGFETSIDAARSISDGTMPSPNLRR